MLCTFYCCCHHNTGEIPGSISQLSNLTELSLVLHRDYIREDGNEFSGKKFCGAIVTEPAWQLLIIYDFFSSQVALNISWTSHSCRNCSLMASGINLRVFQKGSLIGILICREKWRIRGTCSRPSLTHWCRRWTMKRFKLSIVEGLQML